MTTSQQHELAAASSAPAITRRATALIGWMAESEGALTLAGRQTQEAPDPDLIATVNKKQDAVRRRPEGLDQTGVIADPPADIESHVTELHSHEASERMFLEGWQVKVADLSKVCAFQPVVVTDQVDERLGPISPEADLLTLARITIPLPKKTQVATVFDPVRRVWTVSSPNPNLRLVGEMRGEQGDVIVLGFGLAVSPSFMQVAELHGRYVLRDGYHRAFGLLRRGISSVPIFFRSFDSFEEMGVPPGMLPQQSYLGTRPPLLRDYFDDEVTAEVSVPLTQKIALVQGLEFNTIG